jgi:phosphohistidine phosphatase
MDLILWRHAEAEDGLNDIKRALSGKGLQQAALTAAWLKSHLPDKVKILVSPALRTQQTAEALGMKYETCAALAPGGSVDVALAATGWPDGDRMVLVVGHQPILGQIAALLLSGKESYWNIKKSGIWWLSKQTRADENDVVLEAVMTPRFLKKNIY